MTIFDLLFIAAALAGIGTLIVAAVTRSGAVLRKLAAGIGVYLVMVYSATLFSKPTVFHRGEPECNDDWCMAVDGTNRTQEAYQITLRIFSRARRVAQREASATDVYLVDDRWNRYDPVPEPGDVPLNVLLQPGESITTKRSFRVPASVHVIGLRVGYKPTPGSVCLVIGECEAFHKGRFLALD
jgi:hypothetical protein